MTLHRAEDGPSIDTSYSFLTIAVRDGDRARVGRRFSAVAVEMALASYPGFNHTAPVPLGRLCGARSGDKGGHANLGVWVARDDAFAWLDDFLTVDRLRALLPETQDLPIDCHTLPNLRALNFVLRGFLGEGVASSLAVDPQAKGLGEFLRARVVPVPVSLLDQDGRNPR